MQTIGNTSANRWIPPAHEPWPFPFDSLQSRNLFAHLYRGQKSSCPLYECVTTWYARTCHQLDHHRDRRNESGKLARHVDSEMVHLWVFLLEDGVEPTNNRAERALRFAVLWRRMTPGSFNDKGDRWVERILSPRETCRLRALPAFPILVEAISCSFQNRTPEVSWI
jgi:hypothetical protein